MPGRLQKPRSAERHGLGRRSAPASEASDAARWALRFVEFAYLKARGPARRSGPSGLQPPKSFSLIEADG